MSELNNIQKWFTSILVKPGGLTEKIAMADEYYHLSSAALISSTEELPATKRIWIYAGGYMQRLLECMEAEYPALHRLLGEELFNTFAKAYLLHFPSNSPDLYDLGKNFPEYLKASQPADHVSQDDNEAPLGLPVDLAHAERAIAEVSRSKGLEGTGLQGATDNSFFMLAATLHAAPCLRLLRSQYSIVDYINEMQRNSDGDVPQRKDSLIAVSRKNYAVTIHELESWQWHFLQALQQTGDHREAVTTTAEINNIAPDSLLADLMLWTPMAIDEGYLYTVQ